MASTRSTADACQQGRNMHVRRDVANDLCADSEGGPDAHDTDHERHGAHTRRQQKALYSPQRPPTRSERPPGLRRHGHAHKGLRDAPPSQPTGGMVVCQRLQLTSDVHVRHTRQRPWTESVGQNARDQGDESVAPPCVSSLMSEDDLALTTLEVIEVLGVNDQERAEYAD
jgi:hypothetical protein